MPLQDSNLDKLIQSQLCYHYTKRQERGGIIGGRPPERKRKFRGGVMDQEMGVGLAGPSLGCERSLFPAGMRRRELR